jgi:hypothetical protein
MKFLDRFRRRKQPSIDVTDVVLRASVEVHRKALYFVQEMIRGGVAKQTLGSNPGKLNRNSRDLFLEFVVFYLHLIDRSAFEILGPEQRSVFMDLLLENVSHALGSTLVGDSADSQDRLPLHFLELYSTRSALYAQFLVANSGPDGTVKGTLFWEAAKGLTETHFPNNTAALVSLHTDLLLCLDYPLNTLGPMLSSLAQHAPTR